MNKQKYATNDFSKAKLPTNRRELFFDVIKLHFFLLLRIGLIGLLFALPLLLLGVIKDYSFVQNEGISFLTLIICDALSIPCLLLFGVFIAGTSVIYRDFAFMEPIFFINDFKKGIKDNIKPTLISCLIFGIVNFILSLSYLYMDNGFMLAIPFGFTYLVFAPILMHTILLNNLYSNPYFKNFKVGCFLYFKHIPSTLIFVLLIFLYKPLTMIHFVNTTTIFFKYIILALFIVLIVPVIVLGININEMRIFDKRINITRFPELIDKGLYKVE